MNNEKPLKGKVACVTGASRGAGKGIAEALGAEGATVYVTGRSKQEGDAPLPGTIYATATALPWPAIMLTTPRLPRFLSKSSTNRAASTSW